jgi:hypothetical protein
MKSVFNIVLALAAGAFIGGLVNLGIVELGPSLIPPPEGSDMSTMEGLRESMKMFSPVNFIPPFLAHALGTLAGAFITAKVARQHQMRLALSIGVLFLFGGISAVVMLGGPVWFIAADLVLAYLPMGYLGGRLAGAE